jgi:hypothetical protein
VLVAVNLGTRDVEEPVAPGASPALVGGVTLMAGAELSAGTLRLGPDGVAVLVGEGPD